MCISNKNTAGVCGYVSLYRSSFVVPFWQVLVITICIGLILYKNNTALLAQNKSELNNKGHISQNILVFYCMKNRHSFKFSIFKLDHKGNSKFWVYF